MNTFRCVNIGRLLLDSRRKSGGLVLGWVQMSLNLAADGVEMVELLLECGIKDRTSDVLDQTLLHMVKRSV